MVQVKFIPQKPANAQLFSRAAEIARDVKGTVDVNKAGQLVVKGQHWHGRAALWLKDHFIPGHRAARNQRVLTALAKTMQRNYATSVRADLHTVRSPIDRAHYKTGNTQHNLVNRMNDLQSAGTAVRFKQNAAGASMARYLNDTMPVNPAAARNAGNHSHLLDGAGRSHADFAGKQNEVVDHFTGFVEALADNPTFRDGYIPAAKLSPADQYLRTDNGGFKNKLLAGCMIAVMEQEVPAPNAPLSRKMPAETACGLHADQLNWLRTEYAQYKEFTSQHI